ncbi:hypothetical protein BDV93DRAFT_522578 [Ceratobasidium sp. AG-I]|nr:hypothetical protein BDV93DRAFT_522578 [Ceratobasidium sp. AG-I]
MYENFLLRGEQGPRALFNERGSEDEELVVKFVQTYYARAHEFPAAEGPAPKLLFDSGKQRPSAGNRTVMMERVPSIDLYDYIRLASTSPRSIELEAIRWDIERAVHVLQDNNLVFGDLRAPNVMVVGQGTETRGMLVDLD